MYMEARRAHPQLDHCQNSSLLRLFLNRGLCLILSSPYSMAILPPGGGQDLESYGSAPDILTGTVGLVAVTTKAVK